MKNVRPKSKHNSGGTSPSGRQLRPRKRSERSSVADAKTAMTGAGHDIKDPIKRLTDVHSCAKQHPWLAAGAAIAAGFVTGAVLTTPRRKATELSVENPAAKMQPSCRRQQAPAAKKSLLVSAVLAILGGILQTVVIRVIFAAVAGKDQSQSKTRASHTSTRDVEPNV